MNQDHWYVEYGDWVLPLPYPKDSLPFMSETTVTLHYDKHQKGYAEALKSLGATGNLDDIIRDSRHKPELSKIFNNAGQLHNHNCFWRSFSPTEIINETAMNFVVRDFGSFEEFKKKFVQAGMSVFGSGWVWLIANEGKLEICTTLNGDSPEYQIVFGIDVWEHAYYIDFPANRRGYLESVCNYLNWSSFDWRCLL